MTGGVLLVIRDGKRWGVAADGEMLALSRTKRGAEALANEAAEILSASGSQTRVEIPREPRSFKDQD